MFPQIIVRRYYENKAENKSVTTSCKSVMEPTTEWTALVPVVPLFQAVAVKDVST